MLTHLVRQRESNRNKFDDHQKQKHEPECHKQSCHKRRESGELIILPEIDASHGDDGHDEQRARFGKRAESLGYYPPRWVTVQGLYRVGFGRGQRRVRDDKGAAQGYHEQYGQ
ncbi:hypothetical protein GCM10009764_80360 [Nocardia ninae]|uniref:Uncharacterized protein n=1 Tax=Nocardia ninae NBRC 108245 TaxID=1210091 RepID=A0A511MNW1_9NOCA|nr:hypothetical protein NN4_63970 [Nocardia ninae NBRC 108245]